MGRWWNNRKKRWANWGMLVGLLVPNYGWGLRFRGRWVQWTLKSHGKGLKISSMVNIYNPSRLSVGDNVYIGHGTYIHHNWGVGWSSPTPYIRRYLPLFPRTPAPGLAPEITSFAPLLGALIAKN